ncbi:hypothetical protein M2271_005089 [Streptomyces sp. LBL]|uniref:hypothetical protein n=1 Tax=Streptomyces sp. LBL TaxID=2940562 RepID=UPI00247478C9|nr:hypothetical protein [Streptomyces sp. LBL]MDH6627265.1 hypothetical protein [Streptomyces sp. LBL]
MFTAVIPVIRTGQGLMGISYYFTDGSSRLDYYSYASGEAQVSGRDVQVHAVDGRETRDARPPRR